MTYRTLTSAEASRSGTSLRGFLPPISYARLIEAFGEPTFRYGDKVEAEWVIEFADGTLATVYDYKMGPPVETTTSWHIGGYAGTPAVERVSAALGVTPVGISRHYGG